MVDMVTLLIGSISTSLLIASSLLLYFWKEQSKTTTNLIRMIGISVGLIGVYRLVSLPYMPGTSYLLAFGKVFSLAGFLILMFSLLNFLEGKK